MLNNLRKEKSGLQPTANENDLNDFQIGLEFGLSPEVLRMLSEQFAGATQSYINKDAGSNQLLLDEHELALG